MLIPVVECGMCNFISVSLLVVFPDYKSRSRGTESRQSSSQQLFSYDPNDSQIDTVFSLAERCLLRIL
jgi:hypothetical protein